METKRDKKKMPKWGTKKNEAQRAIAFLAKKHEGPLLEKPASAVARAADAPGGGGRGDVASLVQIYAVFSDDVMLRSCAVLRKMQGRHAFNSTS